MLPAMSAMRHSAMSARASTIGHWTSAVRAAAVAGGVASPAAAAAVAPALSRSLHNPRTIRGVGPAPRLPSFLKRPWLRRRLAAQRAAAWKHTHPTPALGAPVASAVEQHTSVESRDLVTGQVTGSVQLDPAVFQTPLRRDIVWEVVKWQRACRRSGNHKTKDRSEVFGSGKKARPQKGSGRARMGDPHAPHHKGGGHAFPKRPSDYSYDLPAQTIAMGKRVALSAKAAEGNLFVIDAPTLPSHKSDEFMRAMLKHKWGSFLMIHLEGELDPNLALSCRRNPNYEFLSDRELNVYDIVRHRRLVVTRKALQSIQWGLQKRNTSEASRANTIRFMVGSFGGGYTRDEVDFVKPDDVQPGMRVAPGVDVDGLKLVIKGNKPFATPIHWP